MTVPPGATGSTRRALGPLTPAQALGASVAALTGAALAVGLLVTQRASPAAGLWVCSPTDSVLVDAVGSGATAAYDRASHAAVPLWPDSLPLDPVAVRRAITLAAPCARVTSAPGQPLATRLDTGQTIALVPVARLAAGLVVVVPDTTP